MSKQIIKADADVMNGLFKEEVSKLATVKKLKIAAPEDPQAFKDHAEYTSVVESVLRDDKSQSWEPNDPIMD